MKISLGLLFLFCGICGIAASTSSYKAGTVQAGPAYYNDATSIISFNATTGANFTTALGNSNWYSVDINFNERMISIVMLPLDFPYLPLSVHTFSYAPQQAPLKISECALPITFHDIEDTITFYFAKSTYMFYRKALYKVDTSQSHCKVEKSLDLSYKNQYWVSHGIDHVSYTSNDTFVDVYYDPHSDNFNLSVAQPITTVSPACLDDESAYLQEDTTNGKLYLGCSPSSGTFWIGTRSEIGPNGKITWAAWPPGNGWWVISLDTRYSTEYGGALVCSAGTGGVLCLDPAGNKAWAGAPLQNYCPGSCQAYGGYQYDPNCN